MQEVSFEGVKATAMYFVIIIIIIIAVTIAIVIMHLFAAIFKAINLELTKGDLKQSCSLIRFIEATREVKEN